MSYHPDFTDKALDDIDFHKESGNIPVQKKLLQLLEELAEHPFIGTGKPEALKYQLSGNWSRRITHQPRLVYQVEGDIVTILSASGHY